MGRVVAGVLPARQVRLPRVVEMAAMAADREAQVAAVGQARMESHQEQAATVAMVMCASSRSV